MMKLLWDEEHGYYRKTNRLGGFEGGMTTGMPLVDQRCHETNSNFI